MSPWICEILILRLTQCKYLPSSLKFDESQEMIQFKEFSQFILLNIFSFMYWSMYSTEAEFLDSPCYSQSPVLTASPHPTIGLYTEYILS